MADAPEKPHRRWYRLTPEHCVVALLALEGLLWLSERFRWFAFNQHKGWTVLICLATVGAAFVLMFLWFLSALIFRWRFQFSIRSLFVLTVVVAIPSAWLATEMKAARKQRETVEEIERAGGQAAYDDGQNYPCDVSLTYIVPPCPLPSQILPLSPHIIPPAQPVLPPPALIMLLPPVPFIFLVPPLTLVPLSRQSRPSCEGCWETRMFVSVREVEFPDSEAGDAEIETLKGLTRLQDLRLNNTKVSDAGLKHLKGLGQLQLAIPLQHQGR